MSNDNWFITDDKSAGEAVRKSYAKHSAAKRYRAGAAKGLWNLSNSDQV